VKVRTIRAVGAKLLLDDLAGAVGVLAELFDHAPDVAFFVNDSLIKRRGCRHKSQVLGRRPCDICPGDLAGCRPSRMLRYCTPENRSSIIRNWTSRPAAP
jgi:hypothetical protein